MYVQEIELLNLLFMCVMMVFVCASCIRAFPHWHTHVSVCVLGFKPSNQACASLNKISTNVFSASAFSSPHLLSSTVTACVYTCQYICTLMDQVHACARAGQAFWQPGNVSLYIVIPIF